MKYYFIIKDNQIVDCANLPIVDEEALNIEVTEEQFNLYKEKGNNYFKFEDNEIILNPDYEAEELTKERARLDMLNLTKADVLLALYEDKGITPDDIKDLYEDKGITPDDIKEMLKDNVPALIKFDYASSYYRGDEVVNALGLALGYTTEEMDYLFENKKFPEKPVEPVEPADADSDMDLDSDSDTDTDVETDNEESEVTE